MTYACETPPMGLAADCALRFAELVPTIVTPRLALRATTVSDFQAYTEIVCTDRGKYVGGPLSREDAWYDFIQMASGWVLRGHGGWAVCTKDSDAPVGFVLLGFEPGDREVELGYLFLSAAEGYGYAIESTAAVRDWAFMNYDWNTLVSYIDADNERSVRLAERLGAKRDARAEKEIGDELPNFFVYRHKRLSQQ